MKKLILFLLIFVSVFAQAQAPTRFTSLIVSGDLTAKRVIKANSTNDSVLLGGGGVMKIQSIPDTTSLSTRINGKENANPNIQAHISSTSNPHSTTQGQVGLGNVNNTSDSDKPISTATQTALNAKQDTLGFVPYNSTNPSGYISSYSETDPVFDASVAKLINAADTVKWNAKLSSESDPVYSAWDKSTGISITKSQVSDFGTYSTDIHSNIIALDSVSGVNHGDQDLSGKVDKITGKGLSTNDYTTVEQTKVSNLSGTNTGDETTSTIKTKLGITTLSGSNTGDQDISAIVHANRNSLDLVSGTNTGDQDLTGLVHTNRTALDLVSGTNTGDQNISAMTHTNRTALDAVSGTNTGDNTNFAAPLGVNDNYVTDAQLVVIGNTSGTNSGDNATNTQYSGLAASKADVGQNFYIGTTLVAINRASAALALTGITSIDGSAATVTGAAQTAITSLGTLTALQVDNLNLNGNIISSTDTNGNITLTPNGTGYTILNGNVGIGTTNPVRNLQINGGSTGGVAFDANTESTWATMAIRRPVNIQNGAVGIIFHTDPDNTASPASGAGIAAIDTQVGSWGGVAELAFMTAYGNASYERMRITSSGNVGIGYSSGTEITNNKLAVNGSIIATQFNGSGAGLTSGTIPLTSLASSVEVPLTFSTGLTRTGNTVTNTITQYTDALARSAQNTASTSVTGLLTSTDWNTFNGKQVALGFTPYNSSNPSAYIPLTALSSTATGLTYTNTTGVFSLTSGYAIPSTTDIFAWNGLTSFPGFGTLTGKSWGYDSHPSTTLGYGLPAYPTSLPASDVYDWAKSAIKPAYTTTEVTEGTKLYYTETRVSANTSVAANTAKVGITTSQAAAIVENTAKVTNATHTGDATGATALTLATVNSNVGTYNTITINGKGLATAGSNTAYLVGSDTTHLSARINLKQNALSGTGFIKASGSTISYDNSTYLTTTGSAANLTSFPTFNQNTTGSSGSVLSTGSNVNIGGNLAGTGITVNYGTGSSTGYGGMAFYNGLASLVPITAASFNSITGMIASSYGTATTVARTDDPRLSDARVSDIAPSTSGKVMTSNGTVWTSAAIPTLNQSTTGNAATATKLAATKTIAGVAFDGSANISLNNNAITNGAGYITSSALSSYRLNTEPVSGAYFNGTPKAGSDGVIEVPKYIDFHNTNTGTTDYDYRLTQTGTDLTGSGTLTATQFNGSGAGLTSGTIPLAALASSVQAPITLTTTGTSGAATFTGNTLNVPNYSVASGTIIYTILGNGTYNASNSDCFIEGGTTGTSTIYLPASPTAGKYFIIKAMAFATRVEGNGHNIDLSGVLSTFLEATSHASIQLIWDGTTWQAIQY